MFVGVPVQSSMQVLKMYLLTYIKKFHQKKIYFYYHYYAHLYSAGHKAISLPLYQGILQLNYEKLSVMMGERVGNTCYLEYFALIIASKKKKKKKNEKKRIHLQRCPC